MIKKNVYQEKKMWVSKKLKDLIKKKNSGIIIQQELKCQIRPQKYSQSLKKKRLYSFD